MYVFLTLHTVYLSLKAHQMSSQLDQLRQLLEQLQQTQTALTQQIYTGTFQNPAPPVPTSTESIPTARLVTTGYRLPRAMLC